MTEHIDHYAEALARLDLLRGARFDAEVLEGLSSIVHAILALREVLIVPDAPQSPVFVPDEEFTEPPFYSPRSGVESFGQP